MAKLAPPQVPVGLLDTTMDQLRTLLAVHEEGTALAAARLLGREQSSVQKQLDTLNRNLGELCGEPLVHKRGRGERLRFTETGESLAAAARATLGDWLAQIRAARSRQRPTLAVGSTRYTLGYLVTAVEKLRDQFGSDGLELRVSQVRTGDLLDALRCRELDVVCGSVLVRGDDEAELDGLDVMPWRRSGLGLVTNVSADVLPGPQVPVRALPSLPLVAAADGLIAGFLRGWFSPEYRQQMDIVAEIDSIRYGFELLRSGVVRASMLVTEGIMNAVDAGKLPDGEGLRPLRLHEDMGPHQRVLVGAFTRAGERESQPAEHPLNQMWDALAAENERWRELSTVDERALRWLR